MVQRKKIKYLINELLCTRLNCFHIESLHRIRWECTDTISIKKKIQLYFIQLNETTEIESKFKYLKQSACFYCVSSSLFFVVKLTCLMFLIDVYVLPYQLKLLADFRFIRLFYFLIVSRIKKNVCEIEKIISSLLNHLLLNVFLLECFLKCLLYSCKILYYSIWETTKHNDFQVFHEKWFSNSKFLWTEIIIFVLEHFFNPVKFFTQY